MGKAKSLRQQIEETVHKRVTPLFTLDRGKLEIVRVKRKEGRVKIRLGGSYAGSPCRDFLVKFLIEPILTSEFDDIHTVEWID